MSDLWTYLSNTQKPIVIYGMGNGADKILSVFANYNIKVSDFFASDGFVRGHSFHGYPVMSYREIEEKYEDFIVILSFASSRPEVLSNIYAISEKRELYAPDVPVIGDNLFNSEFYNLHKDEIDYARELLHDDESKRIFDNVISYKLSGDIKFLRGAQYPKEQPWREILHPDRYHTYVDAGAYTGDTIAEAVKYAPDLKKIYALEPDVKNFKKLTENLKDIPGIVAINKGAWSESTTLPFGVGAGRGSSIDFKGKTAEIPLDSIDNILDGKGADYIKYDVEGAEAEALKGSENTIKKYAPDLLVSLYHRSEDIYSLIIKVRQMQHEYKLYLRRFPYIPAWDLNLYAVK